MHSITRTTHTAKAQKEGFAYHVRATIASNGTIEEVFASIVEAPEKEIGWLRYKHGRIDVGIEQTVGAQAHFDWFVALLTEITQKGTFPENINEINPTNNETDNDMATEQTLLALIQALTAYSETQKEQNANYPTLEAELIADIVGVEYDGTITAYKSLYKRLLSLKDELKDFAETIGLSETEATTDGFAELIEKLTAQKNIGTLAITTRVYTETPYPPTFDVSGVTALSSYFNGQSKIKQLKLIGTEGIMYLDSTFYGCSLLEKVDTDTAFPNALNISGMFYGCSSLKEASVTVTNVANGILRCFYGCSALQKVNWIGDNAPALSHETVFSGCSSLHTIEGVVNIANSTSNSSLFKGCTKLVNAKIKGVGLSLWLNESPLLSRDSVLYLVENAQSISTSQTIYLHTGLKTSGAITEAEITALTDKGWKVSFS